MNNPRCAACIYLGPEGTHDSSPAIIGPTCRRHAPIATGGMMSGSRTMWPVVQPDDWCGDFEPVEQDGPFGPHANHSVAAEH